MKVYIHYRRDPRGYHEMGSIVCVYKDRLPKHIGELEEASDGSYKIHIEEINDDCDQIWVTEDFRFEGYPKESQVWSIKQYIFVNSRNKNAYSHQIMRFQEHMGKDDRSYHMHILECLENIGDNSPFFITPCSL